MRHPTEAEVIAERPDMQALLRSGLAFLQHSRYWLLQVTDAPQARAWLRELLQQGLVKRASQINSEAKDFAKSHEAVVVAFSCGGLKALNVTEAEEFPFPTAFAMGMGSDAREKLLRDHDRSKWEWSDVRHAGRFRADLLVGHFWDGKEPLRFDAPNAGFESRIVEGCPSFFDQEANHAFEPFGFRDGVAQPVVYGLVDHKLDEAKKKAGALFDDRVVAPGEIVLGHLNQYGEYTYCPDVEGWPAFAPQRRSKFGRNGSYLAVRQIRQDVAAFKQLHQMKLPAQPGCPFAEPFSVAEKMIGRRMGKDGTPLAWRPSQPGEPDAFRFRVDDYNGFQCPRGSHIRRANPRDALGVDVETGLAASKLHRLLRRGRTYRVAQPPCMQPGATGPACGDEQYRDSCGDGLFFIACNADLDRQFEFVQQRWVGNPRFGDLRDEDDPIIGGAERRAFSIPDLPIGNTNEGLERFTHTVGGGYFFLPGLDALTFIALEPDRRKRGASITTAAPATA